MSHAHSVLLYGFQVGAAVLAGAQNALAGGRVIPDIPGATAVWHGRASSQHHVDRGLVPRPDRDRPGRTGAGERS